MMVAPTGWLQMFEMLRPHKVCFFFYACLCLYQYYRMGLAVSLVANVEEKVSFLLCACMLLVVRSYEYSQRFHKCKKQDCVGYKLE